jgi:hypothetical protein
MMNCKYITELFCMKNLLNKDILTFKYPAYTGGGGRGKTGPWEG